MSRTFQGLLMAAFTALTVAAGCGADAGPPAQESEAMSAALSDATKENEHHAAACRTAGSMDEMMRELTRHETAMSDLISRMDDARTHMHKGSMMSEHCDGATFEHMSRTLNAMHEAFAADADRMHAATALASAQTECATYTTSMGELMHDMMDDLNGMGCMSM